ncbi:MAG: FAD-binding oxidoreductase [Sinobacteraceae bacterium]|nr:FAD-binding oxidoreductase [Nevskiaceae bacterium]MCP5359968.1 FAD-binding oxidoreductase [Nevskiaceae bacterium]
MTQAATPPKPAGDPSRIFSAILEADEFSLDPEERRLASSDVYMSGPLADAVLRPRDSERLARAVGAATAAGYAVSARGGGMSYTGGYVPERAGTLVIDTSRLDRIVEISADDMYITVEAGVTWQRIHEALKPLGLRLPFFGTFSGAQATVGGGLSNGALFFGTARFGTAADCVLNLEVVLADGTVLRTGQAGFRNVAKPFYRTYGPDLTGVFCHDGGALGIKTRATFRLIRTPAHSGYASFIFTAPTFVEGMKAVGRALSEVARTGAAEEAYVFDPETTRKNLESHDLLKDVKTLANVVRQGSSLLKGLRDGAQLIAAGRDFVPADAFSLHVVCTGRTAAALEAELAACREACERLGGKEIPNSIPKAVRASLFPAPDAVLGPKGDRWAALNAKVAHSDAARIIEASAAALRPYETEMREKGVWMSHLLIAIGSTAFSFEPVFHWFDEWLPMHERMPAPEVLAKFSRPAANPAARELVQRLREVLVGLFSELGASSNQIGKTYPYMQSLEPDTARFIVGLKDLVDPQRLMNPGGLGLR